MPSTPVATTESEMLTTVVPIAPVPSTPTGIMFSDTAIETVPTAPVPCTETLPLSPQAPSPQALLPQVAPRSRTVP